MNICKEIHDAYCRILVFAVLTGEVGKPSEKYVDDFVTSFGRIISNGNWYWGLELDTKLSEIVKNKDAIETTGGLEFYHGIENNWTEEQLRQYINGYTNQDEESVKIESNTIEESTDNEIKLEIENIEGDSVIKWLKHDSLLDVKGTTNNRGSFNGLVEYNAAKNVFIIKAGSQTAEKMTDSWDGREILVKLVTNGYIDPKTRTFIKDCEFNSLSKATSIITMRPNCYDDVYIHNTKIKLIKAYNFDKGQTTFTYKTWIESGRSKV